MSDEAQGSAPSAATRRFRARFGPPKLLITGEEIGVDLHAK
jgi:hypothetical protein